MPHQSKTSRFVTPRRGRNKLLLLQLCVVSLLAGCARGRPEATAAAASTEPAPIVEFVEQWGQAGDNPGQLNQPAGLAVDSAGRIYLASRGPGFLEKFEANGVPLLTFADGSIHGAAGVAVDSGGAIYAADARAGALSVFFPEGGLIRVLRFPPQRAFSGSYAFSVNAEGSIVLPDPEGGRVEVLDPHGRLERSLRLPLDAAGKAAHPVAAMAAGDFVYVADARSDRIVKFSGSGEVAGSWGDSGDAVTAVRGLAVSQKYVFVLRGASPCLEAWTLDGQRAFADDLGGRWNPASADAAAAIATDGAGDLYVLDAAGPRVLHFRIHADLP
jgi:DNA-binding beta-propeller fold protein YncE